MFKFIIKPLTSGFFCILLFSLPGQTSPFLPGYYAVYFTDKNIAGTPADMAKQYLSNRSIERRNRRDILFDTLDVPVSERYIQAVVQRGATCKMQSKWLNAGLFLVEDSITLVQINADPHVSGSEWLAPTGLYPQNTDMLKFGYEPNFLKDDLQQKNDQLAFMSADFFSELGLEGEGICIAVLDAGFANASHSEALEHIFSSEQLIANTDIAYRILKDSSRSAHGTAVLGLIGGENEPTHISSAPSADYLLVRTEVAESEYKIEEFFWCVGMEFADSAGADIVNSSLGYAEFDASIQDYSYSDLDGTTALVSRAATIAWNKGIFVVTSAGNYGNDPWHYITAPADVPDILTVGSVRRDSSQSDFSSFGFESVGYTKPDVSALGEQPISADATGATTPVGYGTSFSAPLVTGATACLLQAFPEKSLAQIKQAIIRSSHLYPHPNNQVGAGIPNFKLAYNTLLYSSVSVSEDILLFPNPVCDAFSILWQGRKNDISTLNIYGLEGKSVYTTQVSETGVLQELMLFASDIGLSSGIYFLYIKTNSDTKQIRFAITPD